jgi:hypothetical protein
VIYKQPIATHQQEMIAALFSLSYSYCAAVAVTAIVASVEVVSVVMAVAVFF